MLVFSTRKALRTAQTFLPFVRNTKHALQEAYYSLRNRPFDSNFAALAFFRPPMGTILLDIGANRGQSVQAMRLYCPNTPIHAFEPCAATFARLQKNTRAIFGLTLIHCGLGEKSGEFQLYTPSYRGYIFDGLASTIREEAAGWLNSKRLYFFDERQLSIHEETVSVRPLDDYRLRPAFIKIDVQGAEEQVLRGGMRTLVTCKPLLYIERAPGDRVESVLTSLGYEAYQFKNGAFLKGEVGRRVPFFIPPERKADLAVPVG